MPDSVRRGRPPKSDSDLSMKIEDVHRGVTSNWIAHVFRLDNQTVKKKLARCPNIGMRMGAYTYDLATAAEYLVQPARSIEDYIKTLKPKDLPPHLNDAIWSARLKQQRWEEEARDLWRTDDVLDVLATAFSHIKTTMQLWVDEISREYGMSDAVAKALTVRVDVLRSDLHETLVQMPSNRKTGSNIREVQVDESKPTIDTSLFDDIL